MFDQIDIGATLTEAKNNNIGVIAKRPSANAPWRFDDQPLGDYCEEYWKRMKRMKLSTPFSWQETALRFAAYTEGVTAIITGTTKAKHLIENISLVEKGPLPADFYEEIRTSFKFNDNNWRGQI